eukprot:TRINITY_DN36201_c0_g1_i1.p1 TRINITY_DN36201_c0_g1~~TRINITY_DN36201_c0_g1_i1.p1  ORF type:complete len:522 (-),score=138.47 TRINITY_DN36201_c0_g1_i1:215-1780(-)
MAASRGQPAATPGEVGLWEQILREAATSTKVPDSHLLMLGRPGIGKRTLVNALLNHASPAAGAALIAEDPEPELHSRAVALDYAYFGVRSPELPESEWSSHDFVCPAACAVLMIEEAFHEKLLMHRLAKVNLKYVSAVICLDMKEPWTMMEDLQKWLDVLQRVCAERVLDLPVPEQDALRKRVITALANVNKATTSSVGSVAGSATPAAGAAASEASPASSPSDATPAAGGDSAGVDPDTVDLRYNMGIPLCVVVTRTDAASSLESQKTMGWSDVIEAYLRQTSLSYGAAIVYTMVQAKNSRNVDVLYDYLMHRMYGYGGCRAAIVPSPDGLFLPSGWDEEGKIDQAQLERPFETVVIPPNQAATGEQKIEECEDMAAFLKRTQMTLHKLGGASAVANSAKVDRKAPAVAKMDLSGSRRDGERTSVAKAGPAAAAPAAGADNTALASFFQNLLTRGGSQAAPGAPGAPAPGAAGAPGAAPAAGAAAPRASQLTPAAAPAAPAAAAPTAEGGEAPKDAPPAS